MFLDAIRRALGFTRKLATAGFQRREIKRWGDFFPLGPIVIGVAFEAARLSMLRSGSVAGLAGFDTGQEHIAGSDAARCFFVATGTGETSVRFMVEFCVRHPANKDIGGGDLRQCLVCLLHIANRRGLR